MSTPIDVAVVGAGPAGLATAHLLTAAGCTVRVLESAEEVGGRMRTLRTDGHLIDTGAEMIPSADAYPATWRLIRAMGLDHDPEAIPLVRDALSVWWKGRSHRHAGRPLGLLTGMGLSPSARLDLARLQLDLGRSDPDPEHPERAGTGEATIADLLRTHHPQLRERLLGPLAAGFFGWPAERAAAAPFAAHLASAGSTATWRTYRDGMDTLPRALAARLDVRTGHPVTALAPGPDGVRLDSPRGALTARTAVLAVPAPVAAGLYPDAPAAERAYLAACGYAPMLRLSLMLDAPLSPRGARRGFAHLVPDDPRIGVVTIDHAKHPGRAPRGRGLISLIATPTAARDLMDAPDDEVDRRLLERVERYLPGATARVRGTVTHRFRHGLPLPEAHTMSARPAFVDRPPAAVDYAGDWISSRPCSEGAVASAYTAAERVFAFLTATRAPTPIEAL
ncbi:NAD(P)/FAD-dependent oxidoreductase [Nocardiopsis sp. JB363]|uniref:protoporphyrinogen/coproporphyrinogen oxidase n=1 Tax=Nocardiopsis sp. JB363 TaxID=1434837 RepID=UPI00097B3108|nr:NAD(P)/FAD-dependent oxidoreductase [Nocardiopsis sp. JB363]SIO85323.1 Protoporphyrinogen IX oxidase, aerobic, HemY [Nocardiopsis sp. JB363]